MKQEPINKPALNEREKLEREFAELMSKPLQEFKKDVIKTIKNGKTTNKQ
jgi:hypothetical protein